MSVDLAGVRVLAVDDDEDGLELLAVSLACFGASCTAAASVDEALELFAAESFDVAVTDLYMPERDGTELVDEIRERERGSQARTAVICVSGVFRMTQERAAAFGFDAYLERPFLPEALAQTIARLVGR